MHTLFPLPASVYFRCVSMSSFQKASVNELVFKFPYGNFTWNILLFWWRSLFRSGKAVPVFVHRYGTPYFFYVLSHYIITSGGTTPTLQSNAFRRRPRNGHNWLFPLFCTPKHRHILLDSDKPGAGPFTVMQCFNVHLVMALIQVAILLYYSNHV